MNVFEEVDQLIDAADPKEQAKQAPRNIARQHGLSPDNPEFASAVREYGKVAARIIGDGNPELLFTAINNLDQQARKISAGRRPDEAQTIRSRQAFGKRCSALGYVSGETDAALLLASGDPARVTEISWAGVTIDGGFVSRADLREKMRTAAYSSEGWRKYLATLPAIKAPEVTSLA